MKLFRSGFFLRLLFLFQYASEKRFACWWLLQCDRFGFARFIFGWFKIGAQYLAVVVGVELLFANFVVQSADRRYAAVIRAVRLVFMVEVFA